MIVTTGKIIKIDAGRFTFQRTCEAVGCVTVRDSSGTIMALPVNEQESEEFIKAYRRAIAEDIAYREREHG
jgi:hypothetical protein